MAQVGKRAVIGVAIVIMLAGLGLGLASPARGAAKPPCPFSTTTSTGSIAVEPYPRPMSPCPGWEWAKAFGSADLEFATSVQETSDGGYIAAAEGFAGLSKPAYVTKLDVTGAVEWQKAFPGMGYGSGNDRTIVREVSGGGYIVAGGLIMDSTQRDAVVIRLDASGNVVWQKTYGGAASDAARDVETLQDGGYVVAAVSSSFGAGDVDGWILRLDSSGGVVWQRTYGTASVDNGLGSVRATADGGFVAAGLVLNTDGGGQKGWVLRLDADGGVVWDFLYSAGATVFTAVSPTSDGGYIVSGGKDGAPLVVRLDASGGIVWQKTIAKKGYGGNMGSVLQISDGGYISAGGTDIGKGASNNEIVVTRLGGSGNVVWQRTYGGPGLEYACTSRCVMQNSDGGFVVAGTTDSYGAGSRDTWLLVLDPNGVISTSCPSTLGKSQSPTVRNTGLNASPAGSATVVPSISFGDSTVAPVPSALTTATQC